MATSGTYSFNLSNADIVLEAFDRCQIRPNAITDEHMVSARRSLNLELAVFSNRGVNLWAVDLQEIALVEGQTDYELDPETVIVLDAYISFFPEDSDQAIDRILNPIGRTDWAMIPNKQQEGVPTVYWFDRTITPTLHIWQPTAETGIYTLKYYRMRRLQDAAVTMGQTADVQFRFLDALCAAVAARLARKYATALAEALRMEAKEAMNLAMVEDRERAPIYIIPDFGPYQA